MPKRLQRFRELGAQGRGMYLIERWHDPNPFSGIRAERQALGAFLLHKRAGAGWASAGTAAVAHIEVTAATDSAVYGRSGQEHLFQLVAARGADRFFGGHGMLCPMWLAAFGALVVVSRHFF